MTHTIIDSPIGPLTLVREDAGLTGVYMPGHRPAPDEATFGERDDDAFADAVQQFGEYWAGERTGFDLPMAPVGTDFQLRIWNALVTIPYGETRTYGWIAAQIGHPTAVRAVGLANSRNPLSILVPCHRVVGASGALTGYAGGVERKRFLLDHEAGSALDVATGLDSVA
ncbi:methylated-DNA--[protein]-cysteine S-methyltransferase [Agrococcus sp. ARC_14]|uniref:methylated-DNA--[protein]-cysteine S-methyltransferase n=1 Tax=Agrococcus sp. ARC_14 TaxID=2919927 RepID=UPI001F054BE9|nr:methylated-DNA--[protein]-cysteine S-methyltransferase [Agrococcus sp. ARC_14]MCH1882091.1 methylated-DNA--[protein]-cysteine S-methyltransferase [Agrococcus sp. ARC_14]